MSDVPVVHAQALSRRFGGRRAVDGVDLALSGGQSLALFGANGAGKTTLVRLLAGLLRPTSGRASVGGVVLPGGAAARARIGMIAHGSMLYSALTGIENVEFAARLHGLPVPRDSARAALEQMRILDRATVPVRQLSRGMQQRIAIARSVVHRPQVLLCDEPFGALDESGAEALSALLDDLRGGGSVVVLITHDITQGLRHATHAAIMRDGRITSLESTSGLDAVSFTERYRAQSGATIGA